MLAVAAALVVSAQLGTADTSPCANPRAAAATILSNLRDDRLDLKKAARCTEQDLPLARREHAVAVLKQALDAVGARPRLENIPSDPAFVDASTFEPTVVLTRALPRLRLERLESGDWVLPTSVLTQADDIYEDAVAVDLHTLKRRLPHWAQRPVLGVAAWQLLGLLLIAAAGALLRFAIAGVLVWRAGAVLARFGVDVTRERLVVVARPLGTLALAAMLALGTPSLALPGEAAVVVMFVVRITAALAALAFCYRVVDVVAEQIVKRTPHSTGKMDEHLVPLVRRILKVVVVTLAAVLLLEAFDINVGSLIAGLGIGGLAVALAAKDTIGNFFGSVAIFLDRPFQIGDWVVLGPDVEGAVEHVGFRSTQIRTIRDTVVSVPNARLTDGNIENFGARRARRVSVTAGLQYGTTPEQAEAFCDGVRAIVAAHPHTRKEDVDVHLHDFGDSALAFMVHFYVVRPTWSGELRVRHEVLLDIVRLARDIGVSFAFPTRTLQMAHEGKAPDVEALLDVIRSYGPGGAHAVAPGPRILPGPPSEPAPAPKADDGPPREP